jgi:hypothetical protein
MKIIQIYESQHACPPFHDASFISALRLASSSSERKFIISQYNKWQNDPLLRHRIKFTFTQSSPSCFSRRGSHSEIAPSFFQYTNILTTIAQILLHSSHAWKFENIAFFLYGVFLSYLWLFGYELLISHAALANWLS